MATTVLQSAYESYLKMDLSKVLGAWIAVSHDKIIAVGKTPKEAYELAMKIDKTGQFLLTKVNSKELELL